MAQGPTTGSVGGGICYGCANFVAPDQCLAYGGITIDPSQVVRSEEFIPLQGPEQAPPAAGESLGGNSINAAMLGG